VTKKGDPAELFGQLFSCRCVSPVNIESVRADLTTDQERHIIPKIIEIGYVDKSETIEKIAVPRS
jgi:hypothetical protein